MGNNTHEVPTLTWVAGHKVGSPLVEVYLREVNHLVPDAGGSLVFHPPSCHLA
jgi:hypothetical protein